MTRLVLGLSEKEMAAAYGVTLPTYRRYEAGGIQNGKTSAFCDFADKYNISIDWLMAGEGARVGAHLAQRSTGKIAILPVKGLLHRREKRAALRRLPEPAA